MSVFTLQEDVMSVEDIDKVMSYGLGHRYAFMGVLETAYLNAEGKDNAIKNIKIWT